MPEDVLRKYDITSNTVLKFKGMWNREQTYDSKHINWNNTKTLK
jgi:hypothetical protein